MKLKITTHTINKKSSRMVSIKHPDTNNSYRVLSVTLKKKDITKTIFV